MESKELRSFFINPSTETLNVEFNLETDGDDEIRIAEISLDEALDFGYDFSTEEEELMEEFDEEEYDYSDEELKIVDEGDIISFLNEYYVVNPNKLPKTELY
jgi:hypothetical protein